LKTERDNTRWKRDSLWAFDPCPIGDTPPRVGFWITRPGSWRFWALTPSAAYWLAAQLNIQMVGAAITDGKGNEYRVFARERKRESVEA